MEHGLIRRMLRLLNKETASAANTGSITVGFLDAALDFFKTYVEVRHHGKEERILFSELALAKLSPEDKRLLDELMSEHAEGRKLTDRFAGLNAQYKATGHRMLPAIIDILKELNKTCRSHLDKEDRRLFANIREYLTMEEISRIRECFQEFDSNLTIEDHAKALEHFERKILHVNSERNNGKGGHYAENVVNENKKNAV